MIINAHNLLQNKQFIKTQKAQGIAYLIENKILGNHIYSPEVFFITGSFLQADEITEIKEILLTYEISNREVFARPCPLYPRHGFVDSRRIKTIENFLEVWQETKRVDSFSELILMPYIEAKYNLVLTDRNVAIGAGHDGATAGKNTMTLPLKVNIDSFPKTLINDCPYFELVYDKDSRLYCVQLRNGPIPSQSNGDYIPCDVTVNNVITAEGDLLEFEKIIKQAKTGSVVHHPGGTLLSHYAVHAVLSEIPIIFKDRKPLIGDVLKKNTRENQNIDQSIFKKGLVIGLNYGIDLDYVNSLANSMLVILHQFLIMKNDRNGLFLAGFFSAFLLRLSYAAILGEMRHKTKNGHKPGREQVYSDFLISYENFIKQRSKIFKSWKSFRFENWPGNYGGIKWACCTLMAMKLEDQIILYLRGKSDINKIITSAHNVINCAHNTGPFLNKFIQGRHFDAIANGNVYETLRGIVKIYKYFYGKIDNDNLLNENKNSLNNKMKVFKRCSLRDKQLKRYIKKITNQNKLCVNIQFKILDSSNIEKIIHFQIGKKHSYKTMDIFVNENTFDKVNQLIKLFPGKTGSLTTGKTKYNIVDNFHKLKQSNLLGSDIYRIESLIPNIKNEYELMEEINNG